jgi:outer membrane protein TolC
MRRVLSLLVVFSVSVCAVARSENKIAHSENKSVASAILTLHQCITECLRGNPKLLSEQYTLAADKENIWKARTAFLPDLTGHAEGVGLSGSPSGWWALLGINDPDETGQVVTRAAGRESGRGPYRIAWGTVATGQVRLAYPLYADGSIFGLNNFPTLAIAKAQFNKQNWAVRLASQDIIANLVGVFYSTVAYVNKVVLDQETVELSKKRLEILEEELKLNLILPQYVEVAKEQLAANEQLLKTSQERAADSDQMLLTLLRRPITQKLRVDTSDPLMPTLPATEGLLSRVSVEHPSVAMQRANIEQAKQSYKLAAVQLYPSVNLETTYTGGTAFGSFPLDQYFIGVGVNVPIFDFGHKLSAEHENLDLLKAAQAQLDQVQLSLRDAILNEISTIHTNEASLADLERNYVEAKTQVDLIQSEHDQGLATQLALVDAQLTLQQVKDQFLLLRLQQREEYANLQRLTGGVWVWNK